MIRDPHAPYIRAVVAAMTEADIEPTDWWISDSETAPDGATLTLSAVLTWDGDVSPDHYPHGLMLCWDLDREWQHAAMRADHSNDWPEDLPLPLWADPRDVSDTAQMLLAGDAPASANWQEWHDINVMANVKAFQDAD